MIQVDKMGLVKNYEQIISDTCPSFSGIIAGECSGKLWVNQLDNPSIAIVYSHAVGSHSIFSKTLKIDELKRMELFIKQELFEEIRRDGYNTFEISIESESLKPYIHGMFEDKQILSEKEFSYRRSKPLERTADLQEDYQLCRLDHALWLKIIDGAFTNGSFITQRLLQSWGSFENFEKKSLAFCIIHDDVIVAVIIGTARLHNIIPIDIETDSNYQKNGFAYLLTVEFVNECHRNGLIAQWDCVESNVPSCNLVKKAGFEFVHGNTVYWFDF